MADRKKPSVWHLDGRGMAFIILFEGFRTTAYRDSKGVWTIGVGHTSAAGKPAPHRGMKITERQVMEIFSRDVKKYEAVVRRLVRVPITYEQYVALVSFCFNVGPGNFEKSSVLRKLNEGNYHLVPKRLMLWTKVTVKGKKKTLKGLVRRRMAEGRLFSNGEWPRGVDALLRRFYGDGVPSAAEVERAKAAHVVEEMKREIVTVTSAKLKGLIRHVATFVGGVLAALGYLDEGTSQEIIGAIVTIGGIIASWLAPEKQEA